MFPCTTTGNVTGGSLPHTARVNSAYAAEQIYPSDVLCPQSLPHDFFTSTYICADGVLM